MYKIKVALLNLASTALVGALMQVIWVFLSGDKDQLSLMNVINMMVISAIIGTVCLFALFYITLKNMGSLRKAIIINCTLVVLLCILVYLQTGIFYSNWSLDMKWVVILVVGIAAGLILTTLWYSRIRFYNNKLEIKKASLKK